MESQFSDSQNSLYKSATSESSINSWCLESDDLKKPSYICGSECSSSNEDEKELSENQSVTMRSSFNYVASKLNFPKSLQFGDLLTFESHTHLPECPYRAEIIGYEITPGDPKFTAYKIRVRQNERWSTSELLSWILFRRYNDYIKLYKKIKNEVVIKNARLPGKSWFSDNFHPHFIGHRIVGLQGLMNQLLNFHENEHVRGFFCIDDPPMTTSFNRADMYHLIFNSHQETVRELREQLRQKDQLVQMTESLKDILQQKDSEVEFLRSEMETLRKQKDTLMKAFSSSIEDLSSGNTLNVYPNKPNMMHGSMMHDDNYSTESID